MRPGATSDVPVTTLDIAVTVLDVAGERPERAAERNARLAAWRKQKGAALPTPNPRPVDPFGPDAVPRRKAG